VQHPGGKLGRKQKEEKKNGFVFFSALIDEPLGNGNAAKRVSKELLTIPFLKELINFLSGNPPLNLP
jgi:hypothetical protein